MLVDTLEEPVEDQSECFSFVEVFLLKCLTAFKILTRLDSMYLRASGAACGWMFGLGGRGGFPMGSCSHFLEGLKLELHICTVIVLLLYELCVQVL